MRIEVGKYTIISDPCCYYITKKYNGKDKNGKVKVQEKRVSGYHTNFTDTLKSFVERAPRDSEVTEFREMLEIFAETERNLKEFIEAEYTLRGSKIHTDRRKSKD